MMIKQMFLLALLLVSLFSKGQQVEQKVAKFVKEAAIDSFFIYSFGCIGSWKPLDSCERKDTRFLLWMKNRKYFIKRFQNCSVSTSIPVDTVNPFQFYISNSRLIHVEELKPPVFYVFKENNNRVDTFMASSFEDHPCLYRFSFYLKGNVVEKRYNEYYLNFMKHGNGQMNLNYDLNHSTKSSELIRLMKRLLELVSSSKRFK